VEIAGEIEQERQKTELDADIIRIADQSGVATWRHLFPARAACY